MEYIGGIDMVELPDNFVGFFGCTMRGGGHNLEPLSVWFYDVGGDWAAEFDSDAIMRHLRTDSFALIMYRGVTIVGYPRSLVDKRGGSKTLFIWKGEHDAEQMINKMKEFPDIYKIFQKLADEYLRKED